ELHEELALRRHDRLELHRLDPRRLDVEKPRLDHELRGPSGHRAKQRGVGAQCTRRLRECRLAPRLWLAVGAQARPLDLNERRVLREPERQDLGDRLADPLLLAVERARVEGRDQDDARLDARRRVERQREHDQTPEHRDPEPPPPPASTHHRTSFRFPPRRRRPTTHPKAPGPRRRSPMSGINRTATSPTSHGQTSTVMRDRRRPLRKASRGVSSADPPVSSASSRRSASSTPRSRSSWAYGTTSPASCEPMTRSPRRCAIPTKYTPSCVIG